MTLTFGPSEDAEGRWSLSMAGLSLIAGLRVIPRSTTDLPDAVTLGLATANLDRDCDMLLIARVNGSEMEGTLRSGRCDLQGERVVAVRLTRR